MSPENGPRESPPPYPNGAFSPLVTQGQGGVYYYQYPTIQPPVYSAPGPAPAYPVTGPASSARASGPMSTMVTIVSDQQGVFPRDVTVIQAGLPTRRRVNDQRLASVVFGALFCCWPVSVFAIYYAVLAAEANKRQDFYSAHLYSEAAKKLNFIAAVSGIMMGVLAACAVIILLYTRLRF